MRNDLTDISIVLDRSGSMQSVRDDTIGGFNAFIEAQRKDPGECLVSLVQFDDEYEALYTARPVGQAPLLTTESYVPRACTALLDAIGRTINETGRRLAKMPADQRPGKVLFVILTDGQENASHEFKREKVFEMIAHQKSAYHWDFVFIGANQDAIAVGASIGIAAGSTLTYTATSAGTRSAFMSASKYASNVKASTSGTASFDAEDRKAQADAGSV